MKLRRLFTFVEILMAAVILSMAVAMVLSIVGSARARILRAERVWGREHLLSNATELYLMAGKDGQMPEGLLPEGFSARCDLTPVEDLPDKAAEPIPGWTNWRLGQYRVIVYDTRGNALAEHVVEKAVLEDEIF